MTVVLSLLLLSFYCFIYVSVGFLCIILSCLLCEVLQAASLLERCCIHKVFIITLGALRRQLDLFQCLEDVSALYMGPGSSLVQKSLRILEIS